MMRLPFAKGLWLTVVTGVVIAGLALAGVVASLGCGGGGGGGHGNGGNDEPEKLLVSATMSVQVVTSAWVPVSGQEVLFQWRGGTSASLAGTIGGAVRTTGENGWSSSSVRVHMPRNNNLYVEYYLMNGDESLTMWTWEVLLANRVGDTEAGVGGSSRLFLPGGGLEDP